METYTSLRQYVADMLEYNDFVLQIEEAQYQYKKSILECCRKFNERNGEKSEAQNLIFSTISIELYRFDKNNIDDDE